MKMKEIRLHGRGGQGVVKESQIVVKAAVSGGIYGQFIPFFGVERKGSPVYGYLRLSRQEIRRKMQIYEPDVIVIMDDTLIHMPETYAGLKAGGTVLINTQKPLEALNVPDCAGLVAAVNATQISEELFGKNLPNTAMLGAFARVVALVDKALLFGEIEQTFGGKDREAAELAFGHVNILKG
jgi:2-oxoacid:acceptor oxidoreductase gamma subunit (pyruvate/2-ketoisovalerate family)